MAELVRWNQVFFLSPANSVTLIPFPTPGRVAPSCAWLEGSHEVSYSYGKVSGGLFSLHTGAQEGRGMADGFPDGRTQPSWCRGCLGAVMMGEAVMRANGAV